MAEKPDNAELVQNPRPQPRSLIARVWAFLKWSRGDSRSKIAIDFGVAALATILASLAFFGIGHGPWLQLMVAALALMDGVGGLSRRRRRLRQTEPATHS